MSLKSFGCILIIILLSFTDALVELILEKLVHSSECLAGLGVEYICDFICIPVLFV